ncbi:MAG TPA: hypothetical protein VIW64_18510 [Pyrinomonadaceae bacterium]
MDRVITITRWLARAFWRRFGRSGSLRSGNQGILLTFSVLVLVRYFSALHQAAADLGQNKPALFESLLLGIFLVWMFPLANTAGANLSTRKLLHLPLSRLELFCIRLTTLLFPPLSWAILAGSLAICYPISRTRNPLPGIIAAGCFICFSALTAVAFGHLLRVRFFRRFLLALLPAAGALLFYFAYNHGPVRAATVTLFTPAVLVTRAAMGSWLAVVEVALLAAVAFVAAFWAFNSTLELTQKPRSRKLGRLSSLRFPGTIGGLVAKDFRYFRRLLDSALAVIAAIVGCVYLITAEISSAAISQIFLLIIFACNSPLAFNSFGLDNRAAMDRLQLMPLTGQIILAGKNIAFVIFVGTQLAPVILVSVWRLGFFVSSLLVAEAAAVAAMYLTWGNRQSINYPFKMHFYQFSSSSGTVVEAIEGIGFGSLPGIIGIYAMRGSKLQAAFGIALLLVGSSVLYFISLQRAGNRFAQKHDQIANALG